VLFQAGKNGTGYLIGEATMGAGAGALYSHQVCGGAPSFGGDAYAAGVIYVACSNGVQALAYNQGAASFAALWKGPGDAAGPPIVSAGLVWVVATHGSNPGTKLYGLDPATGVPRYTETLPSAAVDHFASPSAAGGRLFVASGSSVTAYQIALPPPGSATATPTPAYSPAPTIGARSRAGATAMLLGSSLTVSRSGRLIVKLRCASWVSVCRGTITLRTLRAVIAGAPDRPGLHLARARAAVLTLATANFTIPGGHVKAVTLRLRTRARRLLLRRKLLRARVTLSSRDALGALSVSQASVTLRLAPRQRRRLTPG
jgi:hypothetical protein